MLGMGRSTGAKTVTVLRSAAWKSGAPGAPGTGTELTPTSRDRAVPGRSNGHLSHSRLRNKLRVPVLHPSHASGLGRRGIRPGNPERNARGRRSGARATQFPYRPRDPVACFGGRWRPHVRAAVVVSPRRRHRQIDPLEPERPRILRTQRVAVFTSDPEKTPRDFGKCSRR